ncbi:MAG: ABC transporter substrate-binding protein [Candidatus Rokuibacteriota bacterium]|nr:MAG: ABC transporter substrate-binding protein [Candidatus Rokubacteria bacterium]PYO15877.1 MAG: ABC transporter substrate-binding protein [Candidatus Rokubacteria bacterium]
MRLIGLMFVLALSLLAPLVGEAQPAGRVYRVGILGEAASDPSETRLWQAFRSGLRERGWIEGKNILIESRWAEGNSARLQELAADLVRLKVDLIVTRGSIYTQGARAATSSIPIVFTMHADPEKTGHVASLARPGGNITGLSILMTDLNVKGLEFLTSAVPGAKQIAVLGSPDMPSYIPSLNALQEAARPFHLQLRTVVARTGADLETAFSAMARERARAVVVLGFGPYMAARQRIAELALRHRLPTFFSWRDHVEAGGLMSYGPDLSDLLRRAASYVDESSKAPSPPISPWSSRRSSSWSSI